jgi:hypothetical protein
MPLIKEMSDREVNVLPKVTSKQVDAVITHCHWCLSKLVCIMFSGWVPLKWYPARSCVVISWMAEQLALPGFPQNPIWHLLVNKMVVCSTVHTNKIVVCTDVCSSAACPGHSWSWTPSHCIQTLISFFSLCFHCWIRLTFGLTLEAWYYPFTPILCWWLEPSAVKHLRSSIQVKQGNESAGSCPIILMYHRMSHENHWGSALVWYQNTTVLSLWSGILYWRQRVDCQKSLIKSGSRVLW